MHYERQNSSGDILRLSNRRSVDFSFPLHMHKSFELVFVWEGELNVTVGRREHRVSGGHAVMIFPGQPHAYATDRHSLITIEIFSTEYLPNLYAAYRGGHRHHPVFPFDDPDFPHKLIENQNDRYILQSYLYRIASLYAKGELCEESEEKDEHLTYQIVSYMDEHFTEPLTLKAFAAHFGYNYRYMSGLIRDVYGISFPEALHFKRITLARELLSERSCSIAEIAERCGYLSVRSFDRCFKAVAGCSPREYLARKDGRTSG